jgi:D-aminopeptidase
LYKETGSMIAVVATDAPLLPIQLKRLAARVSLGMARTGATSGNGSGDIFIAFSTANADAADSEKGVADVQILSNDHISGLFSAVALATEEAIINALVAAETMVGRDDHKVFAMPQDEVRALLKAHHRLSD